MVEQRYSGSRRERRLACVLVAGAHSVIYCEYGLQAAFVIVCAIACRLLISLSLYQSSNRLTDGLSCSHAPTYISIETGG